MQNQDSQQLITHANFSSTVGSLKSLSLSVSNSSLFELNCFWTADVVVNINIRVNRPNEINEQDQMIILLKQIFDVWLQTKEKLFSCQMFSNC